MPRSTTIVLGAAAAAGVLLCGCTQSRLRDEPDFGRAVSQDTAAQVANPDARYLGQPTPGSNGIRTDAAMERYVHDKVIQPATTQTSQVGNNGGGGGENNGGGSAPSAGQ
jgi:hypothetical protein